MFFIQLRGLLQLKPHFSEELYAGVYHLRVIKDSLSIDISAKAISIPRDALYGQCAVMASPDRLRLKSEIPGGFALLEVMGIALTLSQLREISSLK
jgi:hypothetical protein